MKLKVITKGDPRLRQKSVPVKDFSTPRFKKFLNHLTETMYHEDGIGIAAPQVGENIRVVIIASENGPLVLINPEIVKHSWKTEEGEEGCLSVPGVYGIVKRSSSVKAQWLDERGEKVEVNARGLFARVIQHEIDHLDGILFIDKAIRFITPVEDSAPEL